MDELFDVADSEFAVGCHEVDEAVFVVPVSVILFLCGVECEGDSFAFCEILKLVFSECAKHFFFE